MAQRQSRGPLQVVTGSPQEINEALRVIRDELDEIRGLRGDTALENVSSQTLVAEAFRVVDGTGTLIHSFGTKS